MKTLTVSILALFLMVGCGSDSGRRATSTSGNGSGNSGNSNNGNYDPCRDRGYNCTPTNPGGGTGNPGNPGGQYGSGFTPASYGESIYGGITAAYNASSNTNVVAEGLVELDQDYGFMDCAIPRGSYNLTTTNPGQTGSIVHHYRNIGVRLGSSITATLENVVAMENVQGQWVQDARLRIITVNGNDCSFLSLSFAMPFAN
jgi:hypothetical protein